MIDQRRLLKGIMTTALGVALLVPAAAFAQPRNSAANRAHPGHGFANREGWQHQNASRRIGHAIDYTRNLRNYAAAPVPQAVPQPQPPAESYPRIVTDEIGRNVAAARKELEVAKKAPAVAKDPEAAKSFAAIDKHLAAAAEQHKTMMECCSKEEVDGEMLMKCCDDAIKHLEEAQAENRKLMQRLYPASQGDARKTTAPGTKPSTEK